MWFWGIGNGKIGFTPWRAIRMQRVFKRFWGATNNSCTMWTVCHPMPLTSFAAPNDAAGGISFSCTDEKTDSERLMSLPKITQQAVFEPSFVWTPKPVLYPLHSCDYSTYQLFIIENSPLSDPILLVQFILPSAVGATRADSSLS